MVLQMPEASVFLASRAVEVQGGGVEKDQRYIGEQISSSGEKRIFDLILYPARCRWGPARGLFLRRPDRFAEPGHGTVIFDLSVAGIARTEGRNAQRVIARVGDGQRRVLAVAVGEFSEVNKGRIDGKGHLKEGTHTRQRHNRRRGRSAACQRQFARVSVDLDLRCRR